MLIYNPCPVSYWCPAAWETTAPKLSQTRHCTVLRQTRHSIQYTADTAQLTIYGRRCTVRSINTQCTQCTVYTTQYTAYIGQKVTV